MRTMKKGFTLIELLVVVAIIGILAAVGTPIFQGFLADAKVNATKENHTRAKDMISAYVAKCSISGGNIQLKNSAGNLADVSCSSATTLATGFYNHFKADGWKNPYNKKDCCVNNTTTPTVDGETHIGGDNTNKTIYIKTDIGADPFLNSSVVLE